MAYKTGLEKEIDHIQPPQSLDAERQVIGSILKDDEAINIVVEKIETENCFYYPKHQIIYKAILELLNRSEPCDIVTVANVLLSNGQLENIGGRSYLVDLAEGVVSTANVQAYASIVFDKYLLRQLIHATSEIQRSAHDAEGPVEELLDNAEGHIFRISESRLKFGFIPLKHLVHQSITQIERIQADQGIIDGVLTGFTDLDKLTQGLRNGDFVVIAGRPSMGKSALAMNIAENVAESSTNKKAVAVFSVEMSKEQLALRLLCGGSKISQHKLRGRKLNDGEWNRLTYYSDRLSRMDMFIDDSATLTTLQMRAKARRLKAQYPHLCLIIVDYIQMMHASGKQENRQQEISTISRGMKALAKELNVPVVVCSQLSRGVEHREEKRPQLADLRESGAIEQDADVVMFVYRPEYYLTEDQKRDQKNADKLGIAEVIVAKQRNGPTGTAKLTFLNEFARFVNMEYSRTEIPPDAEPVGGDMPF